MLSSPPVNSAIPAMKSPSTRLLVTTVHCTIASGNRAGIQHQQGESHVGQHIKPEEVLNVSTVMSNMLDARPNQGVETKE